MPRAGLCRVLFKLTTDSQLPSGSYLCKIVSARFHGSHFAVQNAQTAEMLRIGSSPARLLTTSSKACLQRLPSAV
jgi:hypothetical protein